MYILNGGIMRYLLMALCFLFLLGCRTLEPGFTPKDYSQEVSANVFRLQAEQWTGIDDTQYLQEVLDSDYDAIVITASPGPWVTEPLFINRSNLTLFFEEGSRLEAKPDSFYGGGDCLLSVDNQKNISFIGLNGGGTLSMRRSDYKKAPYEKAEWRHVFNLRSASGITIQSLTIEESGGDGIYIGVSDDIDSNPYSENILIEGCLIRNHYRQGISVISAVDLTINECEILNTKGTAPEAGIDFEPNRSYQVFQNCKVTHCRIQGNRGPGILIWLKKLNFQESLPVQINIENCDVRKNPLGINIGGLSNNPEGRIQIHSIESPIFNIWGKGSSLEIEITE